MYQRGKIPPVFAPLLLPGMRYRGAYGGRGGGKSHFFAEQLVEDCLINPGMLAVCIREVQRSLAQSSKRLIESKIRDMGVSNEFKVFKEVIETPGDGVIVFNGMQDHTAESIKSLEGFTRAWMEEAQKISATSLRLLRPTIREKDGEIWGSWNPSDPPDPKHPEHSVDGLLRGTYPPPRALAIPVNLWDNTKIEDDNPLWEEEGYDRLRLPPEDYAHIWEGAYLIRSEKRVFKNWRVDNFTTPPDATFRFGADFGFAVDPSVLVRCFIGRFNANGDAVADDSGRTLFIDHEAYRVGCDVDHTPALFAGNSPFPRNDVRHWENPYGDLGIDGAMRWHVTADSARPETISYLSRKGFDIDGARKGPGSVEEGINFLKSYDIVIHSRCEHAANEFLMYSYKTDKLTDRVLPVLEDKKNHVIDACRYAVEDVSRNLGWFDR